MAPTTFGHSHPHEYADSPDFATPAEQLSNVSQCAEHERGQVAPATFGHIHPQEHADSPVDEDLETMTLLLIARLATAEWQKRNLTSEP